MVIICSFIRKIYHRLLLHVIFYLITYKIFGESQFYGKRHYLVLQQGTEIQCLFTKIQYKDVVNMHTSAGELDTVHFVVRHSLLCLKAWS
jgi:hypothetical protein